MKFVCLECDEPLKLKGTKPTEGGSLALQYECPQCSWGVAMLTNPQETQVVASLGVEIGPGASAGGPLPAAASKCPIAGVAARAMQESTVESSSDPKPQAKVDESAPPTWTEVAEQRLGKIPFFVRPMARSGIEKFARERGYPQIDEEVLDEAKDHFGM